MNHERIILPRRTSWATFYFLTYAPIATVMSFVCTVGVYSFIKHGGPSSLAEIFILLGFATGVCIWIWLIFFTIRLVRKRKLPLALIDDDGVHFPLEKLDFLAWAAVDRIESTRIGRWTKLRFVLHEPEKYIGRFRRRWQWPYHDSVLIPIELDGSVAANSILNSIQIAHRQSQKMRHDQLDTL